uniref:Amphiphysin n=1 Tax=Gadus morhua TaxID=8049 RepID=A0A8C5AQ62_GADMO
MAEIKTGIFAKNVQKRLSRAQEKVLQKLGKADETKDEQFEQVVVNFKRQESEGSRLQREMKAYMAAIKGMQQASINLSESLHEVYEPDWYGKDDVMVLGKDSDALWEDFHNKLVDSTLLNLDGYLTQFPDLKTRVAKRSRKLIDYDSARHHMETLQASGMKNDRKMVKAEEELKKAQKVFDELNVGLQDELPTLWDSRVGFYVNTFKNVTSLEAKFHREISLLCKQLYEVMTKLGEQHSDKMFTIQGAPRRSSKRPKRDSGPLRLARTPSPPDDDDDSPPTSPEMGTNHMLMPHSPGPPRPKSPMQGPPVPPPPKATPTREVAQEQIIDLFGGDFLPAPTPSQPNERPGESLMDLDFDAFQPDDSVSPIPQTAVPWDMWSGSAQPAQPAADSGFGFVADWSADFGGAGANGDGPVAPAAAESAGWPAAEASPAAGPADEAQAWPAAEAEASPARGPDDAQAWHAGGGWAEQEPEDTAAATPPPAAAEEAPTAAAAVDAPPAAAAEEAPPAAAAEAPPPAEAPLQPLETAASPTSAAPVEGTNAFNGFAQEEAGSSFFADFDNMKDSGDAVKSPLTTNTAAPLVDEAAAEAPAATVLASEEDEPLVEATSPLEAEAEGAEAAGDMPEDVTAATAEEPVDRSSAETQAEEVDASPTEAVVVEEVKEEVKEEVTEEVKDEVKEVVTAEVKEEVKEVTPTSPKEEEKLASPVSAPVEVAVPEPDIIQIPTAEEDKMTSSSETDPLESATTPEERRESPMEDSSKTMPIPSVVIEPASSNEGDDDRDGDIISPVAAISDNGVMATEAKVSGAAAGGHGLPDGFLYKVETMHDFEAANSDELELKRGDMVLVVPTALLEDQDAGWLTGFKESDWKTLGTAAPRGLFPENFTQRVD